MSSHLQEYSICKELLMKLDINIDNIKEIMKYTSLKDYKTLYKLCLQEYMEKVKSTICFYLKDENQTIKKDNISIGQNEIEYLFRYNTECNYTVIEDPLHFIFSLLGHISTKTYF